MRDAFRFSLQTSGALVGLGLLAFALAGAARMTSDDLCLRDTDVECTTAGGFTQTLDLGGALTGVLAVRVLPVILAIAVAGEAGQYGSDRRRRARARRSVRRVREEPGS